MSGSSARSACWDPDRDRGDRPAPAARVANPPPRRRPRLLGAFFWLLIVLLYLPIAILFIFSINDGTSLSLPLRGFTLEWYEKLLSSAPLLRAAMNSLLVAAGASTVATVLGTMVAILFSRFKFRGRAALAGLAILPLIVPYVVLGVSLLILFKALDIPLSMVDGDRGPRGRRPARTRR